MNINSPLNKEQVRAALRFEGPPRPPRAMTFWIGAETLDYYGSKFTELQDACPDDVCLTSMNVDYWNAPEDDKSYRWAFGDKVKPQGLPVDACPVITDWKDLSPFIEEFPTPYRSDLTVDRVIKVRQNNPSRYVLVGWGHFFHQRLAYFRGIENLLYDLYDNKEELRTVLDSLLDFYEVWARLAAQAGADGIWGGDDLGTQRALFMSPEIFREIYKPYYVKLASILHKEGLDLWLHTCGNITEIMPDLIEAGVDAINPIQPGTMNDRKVVKEFSGKITFWTGMDVQQLIPAGTIEQIQEGVRNRAQIFYNEKGGVVYSAANVIVPGIKFENLLCYARTLDEFCREKDIRCDNHIKTV